MMYYLISLFSVIIFLSIIIIGNQINKRLLQICNSIDGTNQRLDRVIPKIEQLFRQYGFEERDGGN
jgi:predicted PurR-regulated permease PerM